MLVYVNSDAKHVNKALARVNPSPTHVKFDATVPYQIGYALQIPSVTGVYLIHDLRGVYYVGQTRDLRRRFDEHFYEIANPTLAAAINIPIGWPFFSWRAMPAEHTAAAERDLIRRFKPACNRIHYNLRGAK